MDTSLSTTIEDTSSTDPRQADIFRSDYRERAAKVAHELAIHRGLRTSDGLVGRAPGEFEDRNSGPLTLPGNSLLSKLS